MAKSLPIMANILNILREGLRNPVKSKARWAIVEQSSASTAGSVDIANAVDEPEVVLCE